MINKARTLTLILLSLLCLNGFSQRLCADLEFDGLFDNREYKNDMMPQTIYGMRIMPEIGIGYGRNTLMAGFSKIWEFGADDRISPDIILYYMHESPKWNALFGSIPRNRLQKQLPDALLYDSIAFFEPTIKGTLFQRNGSYFQTELYCNWFSRQTETQREAFRIVWDGYARYDFDEAGLSEDFIHAGWFVTMTHWAKPKEDGHFIYDQFQFNPYIGIDASGAYHPDLRVKLDAGLLFSMMRCRRDRRWFRPIGVLGDIQVGWRMFDVKTTIYYGGCQQPFLYDPEAGLAYHRSDPFYNHTQYAKTEFKVRLLSDESVQFDFSWNLHMTSVDQIYNQQLITVKYRIGVNKNVRRQL